MTEIFKKHQGTALKLRKASIEERKEKLRSILKWTYENRGDIAKAVYADLGKSVTEVELTELLPVTSEIKLALKNLNSWARMKRVPTSLINLGTRSYIKFEPKGTTLIIAPWNYPFNLTLSPLVSAIAAGNTAIIKPSERAKATANLLERMVAEVFDQVEVTVVKGGVQETQELLALPFDHIFFTGSPKIGKIIMAAAAKNLSSVTLELGGKTPAIVDETADARDAAKKLSWGKFTNCGQTCVAPDYIMVHESKYEDLKDGLIFNTQKMYNSSDSVDKTSSDYPSIIDGKHVSQLTEVFDQAKSTGAVTLLGGEKNEADHYFSPTLLTDVAMDSRVMNEEIFGPILPILKYKNLNEAIALINSKPKPLALYLFTTSKKNQEKVIQETSSGGVNVNDNLIQFSNNNLPFGGVNNSGLGNSHGYHGFQAFSNEKAIMKQRVGFTLVSLFYPPYSKPLEKLVKFVVRYF